MITIRSKQTLLVGLLAFALSACTFTPNKSSSKIDTQVKQYDKPIIIIGASYANASTPFFGMQAPLGGIAVNQGRYLSVGAALVREPSLAGHVINEAQAGATTFDRLGCFPGPDCKQPGWLGYDKQFQRALARVSSRNAVHAEYMVILKSNDCNHPDAFGIPMTETKECTLEQINTSIDAFIRVGKAALAKGITPIYGGSPAYNQLDLEGFRTRLNWPWIVSQKKFEQYNDLLMSRIKQALPDAIIIEDMWQHFSHNGDGLHPSRQSVEQAASKIAAAIQQDQNS